MSVHSLQARLVIPGRPLSSNDRAHWRARAKDIADARDAARLYALDQWGAGLRFRTPVEIVVEQHHKTARVADTANCQPGAKAAIDGIVDYGALPDDSPEHVASVTFLPPVKTGAAEMVITITSVAS